MTREIKRPRERIYEIVNELGQRPDNVNAVVISIIKYLDEEWNEKNKLTEDK